MPPAGVDPTRWPHLWELELADPSPGNDIPVDLLTGAKGFGLILLEGLRKGPSNAPIAQHTVFGWVVSGDPGGEPIEASAVSVNHLTMSPSLEELLYKFWEMEEVPSRVVKSKEEQECEKHFESTHKRLADGRYEVSLPFKVPPPLPIGDTFVSARLDFLRLEKRLQRNPSLYCDYRAFMIDYESRQHMEPISLQLENAPQVFIPHLPVIRKESKTTKTRVVFDASRKSSNGFSLNDFLHVGPKLQCDLFALILQWKRHRYVLMANLEKMFPQILVRPEDRRYQQILWRPNPDQDLIAYKLNTVTYGTASAPFLANRVLKQLGKDSGAQYPLAAPVLLDEFYVDDAVFGDEDIELLRQTRDELMKLLAEGGFTLRKWSSNNPELLRDISAADHGLALDRDLTVHDHHKVLGITWKPIQDQFVFTGSARNLDKYTKRAFLSFLASIYDPAGWLAPFLVSGWKS